MNESRRKEIEGIIETLTGAASQIRQIRVADSLTKAPPDNKLTQAILNIERAKQDLTEALLHEQGN